MWANAQRDGRPTEYRCSTPQSLADAQKGCHAVTLPRRETRWNYQGCPKLPDRSQPLVGRSSPYCEDMWRRYCCLRFFPIIDMCLSCEDMARQSAMVPRWRFFGEFLGPAFLASRAQHVSDLGPDSQTILGQTYDISYDNILWPIHRTLMTILGHILRQIDRHAR